MASGTKVGGPVPTGGGLGGGAGPRWRASPGLVAVVVAFLVVRALWWLTGGGFGTAPLRDAWQLLDLRSLEGDPFGSAWLLHIQPPLFNFLVGAVLRWSPVSLELTMHVAYAAMGLVLAISVRGLLLDLGYEGAAATAGALVVVADPQVLVYENLATYEYPVLVLLVLAARACARYGRRRTPSALAVLALVLVLTVLIRALLHPLWMVGVLALVLWALPPPRGTGRRVLAVLAVAALPVAGWVVKNQVLFGEPTLSSWFGMNLSRGVLLSLPEEDTRALTAEGRLSPSATVDPLAPYTAFEPQFGPCRSDEDDPVVANPVKDNGFTNFNAECFLPVYRDAQENALHAIADRPASYLARRRFGAVQHFSRTFDSDNAVLEVLRFWSGPALLTRDVDIRQDDWTRRLLPIDTLRFHVAFGLVLASALVLVRSGSAAARVVRGERTPATVTWLVVGGTLVFVTLVSIGTEFGENERFRFLLDPVVLGVAGAEIVHLVQRLRRRRATPAIAPA